MTAISRIIEDVLLQEPDIRIAHDTFKDKIEKIKRKVQTDIQTLVETIQKLKDIEEEIKEKVQQLHLRKRSKHWNLNELILQKK